MEPGHEGREEGHEVVGEPVGHVAAMEPGHEGREEAAVFAGMAKGNQPQWSPAMKAGKSVARHDSDGHPDRAAMEPGHEGREERGGRSLGPCPRTPAAMEPGHEGREETSRQR